MITKTTNPSKLTHVKPEARRPVWDGPNYTGDEVESRLLMEFIVAHWADRGKTVTAKMFNDSKNKKYPCWSIRTDMVGGLPIA